MPWVRQFRRRAASGSGTRYGYPAGFYDITREFHKRNLWLSHAAFHSRFFVATDGHVLNSRRLHKKDHDSKLHRLSSPGVHWLHFQRRRVCAERFKGPLEISKN